MQMLVTPMRLKGIALTIQTKGGVAGQYKG